MREGINESPINPLPAVVWLLALPMIATEAVFALGRLGLIGGAEGAGLRLAGLLKSAYWPEVIQWMWNVGTIDWSQLYRLLSYAFVNHSFTQAMFVLVFTLALGNQIARVFRPWAVVTLFLASSVGGALIYTAIMPLLPGWIAPLTGGFPAPSRSAPLVGGFPAVYGLVGGFTFLLWTRLIAVNANRYRAFTLIGMLLLFRFVFGIVFGAMDYSWIAEIAAFAVGFGLSFVLIEGGFRRVMERLRQR